MPCGACSSGRTCLMELLKNFLSISWWRNLFSNITFADFPERMGLIREAIANPRSHPLIAALAMAIILVALLVILLTIAMIYTSRVRSEQSYELLNAKGEVIKRVSKEEAQRAVGAERAHAPAKRIYRYGTGLATIGTLILLLIGFGIGTSTDMFCGSCHSDSHDGSDSLVTAHTDVQCVRCHESGAIGQRVTVNTFSRSRHVVAGFLSLQDADSSNVNSTYGSVSNSACSKCHGEAILGHTVSVTKSSGATIRMSHDEPLEAGIPCIECHLFTESQARNAITQGMQTCLYCHNGQTASIDCTYCHKTRPTDVVRTDTRTDYSARLVTRRPDSYCYDCHNPKPCDDCHGTRVPHSEAFLNVTGRASGEGLIHAEAYYSAGRKCFMCHFEGSVSGAVPCSICHGEAYK
jgi:hypothetical protein